MFYCKFKRAEDASFLLEKTLSTLPRVGEFVRIEYRCYKIISILYDYDETAILAPDDYSYFPEIEGTNVEIKVDVV